MEFFIREISQMDREWMETVLTRVQKGPMFIRKGEFVQAIELPGFLAISEAENIGLITFQIANTECEIVSLTSLKTGLGVGTALVEQVLDKADFEGCKRVWCVLTNDDWPSIRFYQTLGFRFATIFKDSITQARELVPTLPIYGYDSIPIRDEIELELCL